MTSDKTNTVTKTKLTAELLREVWSKENIAKREKSDRHYNNKVSKELFKWIEEVLKEKGFYDNR